LFNITTNSMLSKKNQNISPTLKGTVWFGTPGSDEQYGWADDNELLSVEATLVWCWLLSGSNETIELALSDICDGNDTAQDAAAESLTVPAQFTGLASLTLPTRLATAGWLAFNTFMLLNEHCLSIVKETPEVEHSVNVRDSL